MERNDITGTGTGMEWRLKVSSEERQKDDVRLYFSPSFALKREQMGESCE